MSKPITALAVLLSTALLACDSAERVSAPDALAASGPRLAALVDQTNQRDLPWVYAGLNPCNGAMVTITGMTHLTIRTTESSSGTLSDHFHANSQGSGTDLLGNRYQGKDESDLGDVSAGDTFTTTFEESFMLIGTGPNGSPLPDNLLIHVLIHYTANANQAPSADVSKTSMECRG